MLEELDPVIVPALEEPLILLEEVRSQFPEGPPLFRVRIPQ